MPIGRVPTAKPTAMRGGTGSFAAAPEPPRPRLGDEGGERKVSFGKLPAYAGADGAPSSSYAHAEGASVAEPAETSEYDEMLALLSPGASAEHRASNVDVSQHESEYVSETALSALTASAEAHGGGAYSGSYTVDSRYAASAGAEHTYASDARHESASSAQYDARHERAAALASEHGAGAHAHGAEQPHAPAEVRRENSRGELGYMPRVVPRVGSQGRLLESVAVHKHQLGSSSRSSSYSRLHGPEKESKVVVMGVGLRPMVETTLSHSYGYQPPRRPFETKGRARTPSAADERRSNRASDAGRSARASGADAHAHDGAAEARGYDDAGVAEAQRRAQSAPRVRVSGTSPERDAADAAAEASRAPRHALPHPALPAHGSAAAGLRDDDPLRKLLPDDGGMGNLLAYQAATVAAAREGREVITAGPRAGRAAGTDDADAPASPHPLRSIAAGAAAVGDARPRAHGGAVDVGSLTLPAPGASDADELLPSPSLRGAPRVGNAVEEMDRRERRARRERQAAEEAAARSKQQREAAGLSAARGATYVSDSTSTTADAASMTRAEAAVSAYSSATAHHSSASASAARAAVDSSVGASYAERGTGSSEAISPGIVPGGRFGPPDAFQRNPSSAYVLPPAAGGGGGGGVGGGAPSPGLRARSPSDRWGSAAPAIPEEPYEPTPGGEQRAGVGIVVHRASASDAAESARREAAAYAEAEDARLGAEFGAAAADDSERHRLSELEAKTRAAAAGEGLMGSPNVRMAVTHWEAGGSSTNPAGGATSIEMDVPATSAPRPHSSGRRSNASRLSGQSNISMFSYGQGGQGASLGATRGTEPGAEQDAEYDDFDEILLQAAAATTIQAGARGLHARRSSLEGSGGSEGGLEGASAQQRSTVVTTTTVRTTTVNAQYTLARGGPGGHGSFMSAERLALEERLRLQERQLAEQEAAAARIQAHARGYVVRRAYTEHDLADAARRAQHHHPPHPEPPAVQTTAQLRALEREHLRTQARVILRTQVGQNAVADLRARKAAVDRQKSDSHLHERAHDAATAIQARERQRVARHRYQSERALLREHSAAVEIQSRERQRAAAAAYKKQRSIRRRVEHMRTLLARRREAATRIQASYRRQSAAIEAEMRRAARVHAHEAGAAMLIQADYRGHQVRQLVREQTDASIVVQAGYRGHRARSHLEQEQHAAAVIQAGARGRRARARTERRRRHAAERRARAEARAAARAASEAERQRQLEEEAAAQVQAGYRGHRARTQLEQEQHAAAVIQAGARGRRARARSARRRRHAAERRARAEARAAARAASEAERQRQLEEEAAAQVQAGYRGHRARTQLEQEQHAAAVIQAGARGRRARARTERRRRHAAERAARRAARAAARAAAAEARRARLAEGAAESDEPPPTDTESEGKDDDNDPYGDGDDDDDDDGRAWSPPVRLRGGSPERPFERPPPSKPRGTSAASTGRTPLDVLAIEFAHADARAAELEGRREAYEAQADAKVADLQSEIADTRRAVLEANPAPELEGRFGRGPEARAEAEARARLKALEKKLAEFETVAARRLLALDADAGRERARADALKQAFLEAAEGDAAALAMVGLSAADARAAAAQAGAREEGGARARRRPMSAELRLDADGGAMDGGSGGAGGAGARGGGRAHASRGAGAQQQHGGASWHGGMSREMSREEFSRGRESAQASGRARGVAAAEVDVARAELVALRAELARTRAAATQASAERDESRAESTAALRELTAALEAARAALAASSSQHSAEKADAAARVRELEAALRRAQDSAAASAAELADAHAERAAAVRRLEGEVASAARRERRSQETLVAVDRDAAERATGAHAASSAPAIAVQPPSHGRGANGRLGVPDSAAGGGGGGADDGASDAASSVAPPPLITPSDSAVLVGAAGPQLKRHDSADDVIDYHAHGNYHQTGGAARGAGAGARHGGRTGTASRSPSAAYGTAYGGRAGGGAGGGAGSPSASAGTQTAKPPAPLPSRAELAPKRGEAAVQASPPRHASVQTKGQPVDESTQAVPSRTRRVQASEAELDEASGRARRANPRARPLSAGGGGGGAQPAGLRHRSPPGVPWRPGGGRDDEYVPGVHESVVINWAGSLRNLSPAERRAALLELREKEHAWGRRRPSPAQSMRNPRAHADPVRAPSWRATRFSEWPQEERKRLEYRQRRQRENLFERSHDDDASAAGMSTAGSTGNLSARGGGAPRAASAPRVGSVERRPLSARGAGGHGSFSRGGGGFELEHQQQQQQHASASEHKQHGSSAHHATAHTASAQQHQQRSSSSHQRTLTTWTTTTTTTGANGAVLSSHTTQRHASASASARADGGAAGAAPARPGRITQATRKRLERNASAQSMASMTTHADGGGARGGGRQLAAPRRAADAEGAPSTPSPSPAGGGGGGGAQQGDASAGAGAGAGAGWALVGSALARINSGLFSGAEAPIPPPVQPPASPGGAGGAAHAGGADRPATSPAGSPAPDGGGGSARRRSAAPAMLRLLVSLNDQREYTRLCVVSVPKEGDADMESVLAQVDKQMGLTGMLRKAEGLYTQSGVRLSSGSTVRNDQHLIVTTEGTHARFYSAAELEANYMPNTSVRRQRQRAEQTTDGADGDADQPTRPAVRLSAGGGGANGHTSGRSSRSGSVPRRRWVG